MISSSKLLKCLLIPALLLAGVHSKAGKKELKVAVIKYNEKNLILPGSAFPIGVLLVSLKDEEEIIESTRGYLKGKFPWRELRIYVKGGYFHAGKIHVSDELEPAPGQFIEVKVILKKTSQIIAIERIPLNYLQEISIVPAHTIIRAPGRSLEFAIVKRYDNGISMQLSRARQVEKELHHFETFTTGGWLDNNIFTFYSDPDMIVNHTCGLIFQSKYNVNAIDTFEITMNYIDDVQWRYYGWQGSSGSDGSRGSSGCTGGSGGSGSWGQSGSDGEDGPDIEIHAWDYFDSLLQTRLLRVESVNLITGEKRVALLNCQEGGSLTVITCGGNGGAGGRGGDGGSGGNGLNGTVTEKVVKEEVRRKDNDGNEVIEYIDKVERITGPGQPGGSGGHGGNGGDGGRGGNGGNVYVHLYTTDKQIEEILQVISEGGAGGSGGWGGSGGSGGNGGSGSPSGSNGSSGSSGCSGHSGSWGSAGHVYYMDTSLDGRMTAPDINNRMQR